MPAKMRIISLFILFAIIQQHLQAQSILITGKVTDTKGKPVQSASIKILNSNQGTSSDSLGIFKVLAKINDSILVSAISFGDTTISINDRKELSIVLQSKVRSLKQVTVSEPSREQIIATAAKEYLSESEFRSSSFEFTNLQQIFRPNLGAFLPATAHLDNINYGAMVPVFIHREDTKGSRYLLKKFVKGIIVDQNENIISDTTNLLNYDKMEGRLMIAKDANNYLGVDKEKVIAFAFKTENSSYIFLNVPILGKTNYFLLVAIGPKYSVYKSLSTKLVKSTFVSNGLTESGNNYDEFVDDEIYYWIDQVNNKSGTLELKKKSIKEAFTMEKEKTDEYFTMHKNDRVDERFIKDFINYLNQ